MTATALDYLHEVVAAWGLDGAWRRDAACAKAVALGEITTDAFFPVRGDSKTLERAQAVCARCPVTDECRDYADGTELRPAERQGVWGGMSTRERERHNGKRGGY